jgi:hypothetical protein
VNEIPNTTFHLMNGLRVNATLTPEELEDLIGREDSYYHIDEPTAHIVIPIAQVAFIAQDR